jgi:hypothetical protein
MGVTLNGFAKNIAQDIAIDAARFGALADQTVDDAESRAVASIQDVLGKRFVAKVSASRTVSDSSCYVVVSITLAPLQIGLLKTFTEIKEKGFATCEI